MTDTIPTAVSFQSSAGTSWLAGSATTSEDVKATSRIGGRVKAQNPPYHSSNHLRGRVVELNGFGGPPEYHFGMSDEAVEKALRGRDAAFATTIRGQGAGNRWLRARGFRIVARFHNRNSGNRVMLWWRDLSGGKWRVPVLHIAKRGTTCCGLYYGISRIPRSPGIGIGFFLTPNAKHHFICRVGPYYAYWDVNHG